MGTTIDMYTTFEANVKLSASGHASFKNPDKAFTDAGLEYEYKNTVWKNSDRGRGKSIFEVWYNGQLSIVLLGADAQTAIYLRGHCLPGSPSIFTKLGAQEQHLQANVVADRLIESGLNTSFAGVIKCWNCHSAEPVGSNTAFAQRLADNLYHRGYINCAFQGYVGALDSHPNQGGHRYSTAGGRASLPSNRINFQPH